MRRLCPSLTELQAFEATARHLNFTRAASELFVTQGAVSRQVANLEGYLGVLLFNRVHKRLELSEAGHSYLPAVRKALNQLETATAHLMSHRGAGGVVHLSVPPTFATQWLLPRMGEFKKAHPEITLNFVRYAHAHNFYQDQDLDAAVQYGNGEWPGARSVYLAGRDVVPVCAPSLLRRKLLQPAQLAGHTLLQHVEVPHAWEEWLSQAGAEGINGLVGPRFDQYSLIIKAAVSGFGIGLVPRCLVEEELAHGQLVDPVGRRVEGRLGYFLCIREDRTAVPAVMSVAAWLQAQVR